MQGSSTGLILQGVAHAHSVLKESLSSPLLSLTFYFDFVFPNVKFYSNFYSWHHFAGDCAVCMHTKYSRSPCQVPPGASSYYAPLHQGTINLLYFLMFIFLNILFALLCFNSWTAFAHGVLVKSPKAPPPTTPLFTITLFCAINCAIAIFSIQWHSF